MDLRTKAEIAELADVRHQAITAAVRADRLQEDEAGRIDLDDPATRAYIERNNHQRRIGKRRRARGEELQAARMDEEQPDEEEVYDRSVVERCIEEAWEKALSYASEMALPVACEQLAAAVLKAGTLKRAAAIIRKSVETDLAAIQDYVDHAIVFIIDGEEAAARWDDEHFDEDGNPRPKAGRRGKAATR